MYAKLMKLAITVILIIFSLQYIALAEEAATDKDKKTDKLTVEQEAAKRDSELIQKLMLQSQQTRSPDPEVKDVEFDVGNNPILGSDTARLIIVQFSDYSCPHCALFTKETYPEIVKNYIDTGKVRYVIVDYPLPGDTPAIRAAEAAHCASDQGKFREMHEDIMSEQQSINDINSIASFADLDMNKFKACMDSKKYEDLVNKNISLGDKLHIPSVPGFVVAKIDPENPHKVKGISYIRGAKPYSDFQQAIDKALAEIKK